MPCKQVAPTGDKRPPFRTGYATEAECLQACKEGACCEGTTCAVKPQCQCQGAGKVFRGVGTTCAGANCGCARWRCCRTDLASTRSQTIGGVIYYCFQCVQYALGTSEADAKAMCTGTLQCGTCSDEAVCGGCAFLNPLP